ncbi:GNAT family N-acetyltransferase [Seonamhaeicola sp. S2-3]|uniref:GNAT family N-acetyltransferase n=1 Tax=Seonamhaeicola sp. S2-3 TaxID=1936081 RepID=UPI000972BCA9|nr:GNAT family N-acetyltransferase [Seonamhaeicola sp. S2-3]APY09887.1 GNAT family N-acetyltransferase [Seonamhaeicola sp. S2-3]
MIEIVVANKSEHFNNIATLADIIWQEHYIPIIGLPQVNYMLKKFQSAKAIKEQVEGGFEYYLLSFNKIPVGYISIKKETDTLFLSKLYVVNLHRGKKIGKTALNFVANKAKAYNLKRIRLTVNINNVNAIKAYEKMGFKKEKPIVTDIGSGFIMDDFEMVKEI